MNDDDRREGNQGTQGRLSSGGCSGVPGCRGSEMARGGHPPWPTGPAGMDHESDNSWQRRHFWGLALWGEQENREVMKGALWVSFSIFPLRLKVSQHLYALWSRTNTFLCFWTQLCLGLAVGVMPRRRTLAGPSWEGGTLAAAWGSPVGTVRSCPALEPQAWQCQALPFPQRIWKSRASCKNSCFNSSLAFP